MRENMRGFNGNAGAVFAWLLVRLPVLVWVSMVLMARSPSSGLLGLLGLCTGGDSGHGGFTTSSRPGSAGEGARVQRTSRVLLLLLLLLLCFRTASPPSSCSGAFSSHIGARASRPRAELPVKSPGFVASVPNALTNERILDLCASFVLGS